MEIAEDTASAQRIVDGLWPGAAVELLLRSENTTFRVRGAPRPAVLRLHRAGYQDDAAIVSELAWIAALRRDTDVALVEPLEGGRVFVDSETGRRAVLFAEIPGAPVPDAALDVPHFTALGAIAATLHAHAQNWKQPPGFSRFTWGVAETIGERPRWGSWREHPGVTAAHRREIEPAAAAAAERVTAFGTGVDRFGLIHGDLRAANLIAASGGAGFTVIDFDDAGFGWYLFEFAAAASFVETDPRLPEWAAAWTSSYRAHRDLPDAHAALLPDFVLLRRLQLLGWLGTHGHAIESDPAFADGTVDLARRHLSGSLL